MSASTLSITANPAGTARRRPVTVGEKKFNNVELLPNELQLNGGVNTENDKSGAGTGSKDPILAESVSRELVQVRRVTANNSMVSPRRSRKSPAAAVTKPRWMTVLSVFAKNFVLLVVLIGLVQMVRRLALKSGDSVAGSPMGTGLSELEGRVADIESLVKTTAKMIQVQVEVVDRKIESQVGGLRKEFSGKIEEKTVFLERQLKELEAKSEGLERSLSELKAADWLSKEEFDKIFEELRKGREFGENDVSLDEVRMYARDVVLKEIEKHAADGLGRVDYALWSGGGNVVKHSEPYVVAKWSYWFSMSNRNGVHAESYKMLKPSFGEPGQCFPLKGSSGFVQIRLRTPIVPEAITLEHVAKSVAYDRSSAPRDCRISGWLQGHDSDVAVAEKMFLLTEFTYDLEKSSVQTFNVLDPAGSGVVDTVRLDFTSNHGSSSHTCMYRLRVHGHEPDHVSMMAMQY
ncbi:Sad1_UNC domain-containing protein [Cephalotus follicularis]|uniref:Sad1_UNC domain-containing protein n=1 Tax=Cephalotus follicularis TaxID=3775 RepID=A0A1Q3BMZ8_CEPFO|nr:Sad1_UNC domain-containing protein [Cephalotus follicularis]